MNEQVREIAESFIRKVHNSESAFHGKFIDENIHHYQLDAYVRGLVDRIAAIMPKPLDVEVIEKILFDVRDKTIRHYPVPTSLIRAQAQAIAARSCAPVERVCAWKTEDRIAHVVVSTDCGKAFSYPCARCELVDKFGPYCTCGGKIEIEER